MTAAITCPACGLTSHHPQDVSQGYCGNCHDWTGAVGSMEPRRTPGPLFDRQGHPITTARHCHLFALPFEQYRRIAYVDLGDGLQVSTVWLGYSMGPMDPPVPVGIFETALIVDDKFVRLERANTEDEARHTHDRLVRSLHLVGRDFLVAELQARDE